MTGAGGYSSAQSIRSGQYVVGIVGAVATAFGAYELAQGPEGFTNDIKSLTGSGGSQTADLNSPPPGDRSTPGPQTAQEGEEPEPGSWKSLLHDSEKGVHAAQESFANAKDFATWSSSSASYKNGLGFLPHYFPRGSQVPAASVWNRISGEFYGFAAPYHGEPIGPWIPYAVTRPFSFVGTGYWYNPNLPVNVPSLWTLTVAGQLIHPPASLVPIFVNDYPSIQSLQ